MNKFIIAGTLSLVSLIVNAQAHEFTWMGDNVHKKQNGGILSQQTRRHGEKPTAIKKRIVAYSKYQKGNLTDSISNFYSGTRGSSFHNAVENAIAAFPFYTPGGYERQIVQCDSFQYWNIEEGETEIGYSMGLAYEYNEQQQPVLISMAGGFQTYELSYNTAHLLSSWELSIMDLPATVTNRYYNEDQTINYDSTYDAMTSTPSSLRRYAYNDAGLVIADSLFEWKEDNWALASTTANTYDDDSRITESIFSETESAGETLITKSRETYAYEGDNPIAAENISYFWDGTSWVAEHKYAVTFNEAGDPESNIRYELLDGAEELSPVEKIVTDYDSEGLITEANTFAFVEGELEEESSTTEYMYYEDYDDGSTTKADDIILNSDQLLIYPVPASEWITVTVNKANIKGIIITDGTGRIVLQEHGLKNSATIATHQLAAGIYYARVSTDKGFATQRFVISK